MGWRGGEAGKMLMSDEMMLGDAGVQWTITDTMSREHVMRRTRREKGDESNKRRNDD